MVKSWLSFMVVAVAMMPTMVMEQLCEALVNYDGLWSTMCFVFLEMNRNGDGASA
jgi:hypothetical protein